MLLPNEAEFGRSWIINHNQQSNRRSVWRYRFLAGICLDQLSRRLCGPSADLPILENRYSCCVCQVSNSGSLARRLVTIPTTVLQAPPCNVIWCVLQCGIVFQCVDTWLTNANLLRDACFFHNVLCQYVVVMAITVIFVAQIMHCDKYVATAHWDIHYVERHSKIVFMSVTWYVNCRHVSSPNVILYVKR